MELPYFDPLGLLEILQWCVSLHTLKKSSQLLWVSHVSDIAFLSKREGIGFKLEALHLKCYEDILVVCYRWTEYLASFETQSLLAGRQSCK
jgi:hypothetical protein